METNNTGIATIEELKAEYPGLTAAIEENARTEERNRIKAIREAAIDGFEDIVEDAMFKNPVSAETMALNILKAQKKQGGKYLEDREKDVEESGVNNISAGAREKGSEMIDPFNAAIDKLFPENR